MKKIISIACCAAEKNNGGIYNFKLTNDGRLLPISYLPADDPMYSAFQNNKLFVLKKTAFGKTSGLFSADVLPDGAFGAKSETVSTNGVCACHLSAEGNDIYTVNYLSGNIVKIPDTVVTHSGKGIHPTRQEAPHTHCVILSPCKKYVLATDLGLDMISVSNRELSPISEAYVPQGHGVRHIVFSHDGKHLYAANELTATVSVFKWDSANGKLTLKNTFDSQVPPEKMPITTAAAIRISNDDKKLYISNRGENTVVCFCTDDGENFKLCQKVPCEGNSPRDFDLTPDERFLICTNEGSDSVTVFAVENGLIGKKTDEFFIPSPICVIFI